MENNELKNLCDLSILAVNECKRKMEDYIMKMGKVDNINIPIHRQLDECYSTAILESFDNGIFYFKDENMGNFTEGVSMLSINELYDIVTYLKYKHYNEL